MYVCECIDLMHAESGVKLRSSSLRPTPGNVRSAESEINLLVCQSTLLLSLHLGLTKNRCQRFLMSHQFSACQLSVAAALSLSLDGPLIMQRSQNASEECITFKGLIFIEISLRAVKPPARRERANSVISTPAVAAF